MRILNKFGNIKAKLLLIYILTIFLIILTVGGLFYAYCRNMAIERIRDGTNEKMRNAFETISTIERCIDRACSYISGSNSFFVMIEQELDDEILRINNQESVKGELENVFGTIFDIQSVSPYVHRLKFYISKDLSFVKNGYVNAYDNGSQNGMVSTTAVENEGWYKELIAGKERIYVYTENPDENYLFFAKQIYGRSNTYYGCCNIGLNINHILETTPNIKAAVIDEDGTILYNTLKTVNISSVEDVKKQLQNVNKDEILLYKNPSDGEKYYVNISHTDIGIKIITAVSAKEENEQLQRLIISIVASALFLLLLGTVVFYFISNKFTSPLKSLAEFMTNGDVDESLPALPRFNEKDEIGSIYRSVAVLLEKVKETREADLRSFKKEKQMEIKMRQIQIGPHFLNNALNTLSCRAMLDGNDDIADYSSELASILEYGLKNPEELVDLETELSYLKKYVYLQNYAYENAVSLKINVPENLRQLKVIKLILQPLAENSILHGFNSDIKKVAIEVDAEETDEELIITVADDGAGCDADELNEALLTGTSKGIGVKNINERLKMHFGGSCGLSYKNDGNRIIAVLVMKRITDDTELI